MNNKFDNFTTEELIVMNKLLYKIPLEESDKEILESFRKDMIKKEAQHLMKVMLG